MFSTFNINQCLKSRHEAKGKAEALVNAATARGEDLVGSELKQYNALVAEIKGYNDKIEAHIKGDNYFNPNEANERVVIVRPEGYVPPARQGSSVRSILSAVYQSATTQQRDQIDNLGNYLAGRIQAAADLRPSGDGAVVIPSFVSEALERNYAAFSPVANVARLFPTETGADVTYPVLSDSEDGEQVAAAASTGADATVSGDTPPTDLDGPTLKAYKTSSKPVFVPRETFTDSPISIVEEIVGALLARIIRFENKRFTTGNGIGQQEGFLTSCSIFEAHVTLELDTALDLQYSVPALYRAQGVYMASDTTIKYLRQLATGISGDKRKLWNDADFTKGTPATLHGAPIFANNDMPDVQSNGTIVAGCLAYGDFKKFVVRQAEQNLPFAYRYAVPAKDGAGVILFRRTDSKLLIPEAIAKLGVSGS
jgi:HK97 family phage major capsid protein